MQRQTVTVGPIAIVWCEHTEKFIFPGHSKASLRTTRDPVKAIAEAQLLERFLAEQRRRNRAY